jgi:hypothetical protein
MFWLVVLSTAFLGVGAIVFVLARDAFRGSRVHRETPTALSVQQNGNATAINTLMREHLHAPPPSHPAALFSSQHDNEADAFADTLAHVKENPVLPIEPKSYLLLEERDESLERLLARHSPGQRGIGRTPPPPKEFSIAVTEKKEV